MTKLIIIRGPSGAGKSTVAKALMEQTARPTALVDLDYYRFSFVNAPPDGPSLEYELSTNDILTSFNLGFDVIFDGNFRVQTDGTFMTRLFTAHPEENYLFYLDVNLEETITRHKSRPQKITEEKMRELYQFASPTSHPNETVIKEGSSLEETVNIIKKKAGI